MILNLESGMDISAAIEKPRWHNQVVPQTTTVEVGPEGEDEEMNENLRRRGHEIRTFDINSGRAEGGWIFWQKWTRADDAVYSAGDIVGEWYSLGGE